ncbi:MAG TPA: hypothetical protein PKD49_03455 [Hyphomicrobium sp.]|mgnify:CR=1 FL=1|nr:hypothetical protein [Hyphomicrobium sp.]
MHVAELKRAILALEWEIDAERFLLAGRHLAALLRKANFNPGQPRVPAGNSDGGQWTDSGGAAAGSSGEGQTRVAQNDEPERYRVDLLEEERSGGHTYRQHVGKSEEALKARVRASILADPDPDRHSIRSGSFTSLDAASKLVDATLARNRNIVDLVVGGTIREQRVDAYFDSLTGYEAYAPAIRSEPRIRETYGVGVYIRHDPSANNGYRVISAYPRNLD